MNDDGALEAETLLEGDALLLKEELEADETPSQKADPSDFRRDMLRFYTLAKRQAWKVEDLSWGQIPYVPEGKGSGEKRARRLEIWRSVVTQQLQADTLASLLSSQLLAAISDTPGRLYYSTMVQDEGRHAEVWLRLSDELGGVSEPDPYLTRLGELTLNADTLQEKIWLFQVVFEGLVIDRFRQIAAAAPGTILAELCNRLTIDDGIHHASGVRYEQNLLEQTSSSTKRAIARVSKEMWPLFEAHLLWRPKARSWASSAMQARDLATLKSYVVKEQKLARKVGLEIEIPLGYE